jgi:hypothetical protein
MHEQRRTDGRFTPPPYALLLPPLTDDEYGQSLCDCGLCRDGASPHVPGEGRPLSHASHADSERVAGRAVPRVPGDYSRYAPSRLRSQPPANAIGQPLAKRADGQVQIDHANEAVNRPDGAAVRRPRLRDCKGQHAGKSLNTGWVWGVTELRGLQHHVIGAGIDLIGIQPHAALNLVVGQKVGRLDVLLEEAAVGSTLGTTGEVHGGEVRAGRGERRRRMPVLLTNAHERRRRCEYDSRKSQRHKCRCDCHRDPR